MRFTWPIDVTHLRNKETKKFGFEVSRAMLKPLAVQHLSIVSKTAAASPASF